MPQKTVTVKGNKKIVLKYEIGDYEFEAYDNGKKIGHLKLDYHREEDDTCHAVGLDVDATHRLLGIAEELFKYAKRAYRKQEGKHFLLENFDDHSSQNAGMSSNGRDFFFRMQAKGLLSKEQSKQMDEYNGNVPDDDF